MHLSLLPNKEKVLKTSLRRGRDTLFHSLRPAQAPGLRTPPGSSLSFNTPHPDESVLAPGQHWFKPSFLSLLG